MLDIEQKHLNILISILEKHDYQFFVFGSRANGRAKKFSDLDLVFFDPIPNNVLINIEDELEESDLPYKVDIVDYNKCDEDFKKIIRDSYHKTPLSHYKNS